MKTSQYSRPRKQTSVYITYTIKHLVAYSNTPKNRGFRCAKWTCNHNTSITQDILSALQEYGSEYISGITHLMYILYSILSLFRSDVALPYVERFNSLLLSCVYMLCNLLDIIALSELEAQAFHYTHNNIR
jgi:hypothetical protein